LRIRKLVLGPFRSGLNPIGLMSADLVASQVIRQANLGLNLIIVTPNPLTYLLMPLTELGRMIYSQLIRTDSQNN
ncbi:MAG TPA: short-chain dehydrogenase, partial [Prochlorococcus sp.]